jgi:hypothetical protein
MQSFERDQLETLVLAHAVGDVLDGAGSILKAFTSMTVTGAVFTLAALQGIVYLAPVTYGFLKFFPGVGEPPTEAQKAFFNAPSFDSWRKAAEDAASMIGDLPGQNP